VPILIHPIARADPAEIEQLLDAAFGTDRHRRTAYRLREGVSAIPELSFAAFDRGALVGVLQCWPVELVQPDGEAVPLVLLGPVAVWPDRQQHGIGRTLMRAALATADATGADPLMLIGDPEYYERLFGFHAAPTQQWELPGPFERRRLLARVPDGRTLPRTGQVRARLVQPAVQNTAAVG
jgi:predicted N-acetyltransferase YhbS